VLQCSALLGPLHRSASGARYRLGNEAFASKRRVRHISGRERVRLACLFVGQGQLRRAAELIFETNYSLERMVSSGNTEKTLMKTLITAAFIITSVTLAVPVSAHEVSHSSMTSHTMADGTTMKDSNMGAKPMKMKMKHKMHHSMSGGMSDSSMSGMKHNGN
jgi:hypothetical protein